MQIIDTCLQRFYFFRPHPIVADNGFPQRIDAAFRRCHTADQGFPCLCFRPVSFRPRPFFRFQSCCSVALRGGYGLDLPRLFGVYGFNGRDFRAEFMGLGRQIIGRLFCRRLNGRHPRLRFRRHFRGRIRIQTVNQGFAQAAFFNRTAQLRHYRRGIGVGTTRNRRRPFAAVARRIGKPQPKPVTVRHGHARQGIAVLRIRQRRQPFCRLTVV